MRITGFSILYDLKTEYPQLRREGCSREEAVNTLMERYNAELTTGAEDDGLLFWVGLADAQYQLKELSEEVAGKALDALAQIRKTDWDVCPGDLDRREKRYAEAPMPERKVGKPRTFCCNWQIGDTYAYQMKGPEAEQMGISGKYMLLRTVDNELFDKTVIPVVTVTFWETKPFPTTVEEFMSKPILILNRAGNSLFEVPGYVYKTYLNISCKRFLNILNLEFVGNFPDVPMPDDEVMQMQEDSQSPISIMVPTAVYTHPSRIDMTLGLYWEFNDFFLSMKKGENPSRKYVLAKMDNSRTGDGSLS